MNPVFPALGNLILPGLGYLMLGKRVVFGSMLLGSTILGWAWGFLYPLPEFKDMTDFLLCTAAFALMSVAFAYDAYQEAKK